VLLLTPVCAGDCRGDAAVTVGVTIHPLTPEICVESAELPGEFHGDPADQIIVATARLLAVPVVTSDRKILDYPHVQSLW
jgi:PIN domain nuclease of toxin-antitoxin system